MAKQVARRRHSANASPIMMGTVAVTPLAKLKEHIAQLDEPSEFVLITVSGDDPPQLKCDYETKGGASKAITLLRMSEHSILKRLMG